MTDDNLDPSFATCAICRSRGCAYRADVHNFTYDDTVIVNKFYCRMCYSTLTDIESSVRARIGSLKDDLMESLL